MFFRTLRDLARPQIVAIFDTLKRSDGLAVGDLANALGMSYMGVKQYCIELEKRGYLDTWRRAKETGRPELTYRLTAKAQLLFPQHSNELTLEILDAVRQLHGPTAAEKILYQYFVKKTEAYAKKIKGKTLVERATSLARLRENEGHCAQVDYDARHGLRLTEFHSPLAELMKAYPSVARMEESMLSRLLQAPVQRDMAAVSGLMRITFLVAGATLPPLPPASTTTRTRPPARQKMPAESPPGDSLNGEAMVLEISSGGRATASECAPSESAGAAALGEPGPATAEAPTPEVHVDAPAAVTPSSMAADRLELESASPEPPPAPTETAPAPTVEEQPLLFAAPATAPAARLPVRTVTPARTSPKPAEPVAEELFLSL